MATDTSFQLPIDNDGKVLQIVPAVVALKSTTMGTPSTATNLVLNVATTLVEVSALSQGAYMKYATGVTAGLFDEYIQAGTTRHYVIPTGVTTLSFIQQASAATLIIIEK